MRMRTFVLASSLGGVAAAQLPQYDWQLEPNLPARSSFSIVRHDGVGAFVVFGGFSSFDHRDDTWLWDGGWRRAESVSRPSPRSDYAVTYDSLRNRLVLVGGLGPGPAATAVLADTWVFDGAQWQPVVTANSPPPRYRHTLVYDPGRDRVVWWGGQANTAVVDQLWEFDGSDWQQVTPTGGAPGRLCSAVHDAARAELLFWDGFNLRAWDGAQWAARSNVGLPVPGRGQLLYDPLQQRVLLLNPESGSTPQPGLYARAGGDWQLVDPGVLPVASSMAKAFDPVAGACFGVSSEAWRADTWQYVTGQWQRIQLSLPVSRRDGMMAYDPLRRRTLLVGGSGVPSNATQVMEAQGRDWLPASNLTARSMATAVFDAARGVTVVFGGTSTGSGLAELFEWDGAWTFRTPANPPAGRFLHAMAYDGLRQRSLLFGGRVGAAVAADFWSWDGTSWTALAATGPSAREGHAMAYDALRDRVVLFGGTDGSARFGDTWEFDGTAWTQLLPAVAPTPRRGHVLVYDPHLARCVLYGGNDGVDRRETWLWDGLEWAQLTTAHAPDVAVGVAAAMDRDRRELILFGGADGNGTRGELWRLRRLDFGQWQSVGSGCDAGNGPLHLVPLDAPAIGRSVRLRLENTVPSFVALPLAWVGFDDQQWNGVPLPIALDALGAPECLVRADAQVFLPILALGDHAEAQLVLPDLPAAVGLQLFVQAASWDFAVSRIGTANLLAATIGVP